MKYPKTKLSRSRLQKLVRKEQRNTPGFMTIGAVSKRTGIGIEAIRFYERLKLIPNPPRRKSGYRRYTLEIIERLEKIKQFRDLGFSLSDIEPMLSFFEGYTPPAKELLNQIREKIMVIDQQIDQLKILKESLKIGLANPK